MTNVLVLVRHGESEWNKLNLFTGWKDPDLTEKGVAEAIAGGKRLKAEGFKFDIGGHRWFTKNEDLNAWFRRLMEGEIVLVDRISRIFHQGKFFR